MTHTEQTDLSARATTLVLGATGKTGRRVAALLEAKGHPVRRGSRSSEVPFDWDDPATWGAALEGVAAVYIVYSPDLAVPAAPAAIERFVALARERGVERAVLLSGRGEEAAQRCEGILQASGLAWTVVRASWFAQNFDEGAFLPMVLAGEVALPAGAVREPFVDVDDVAEVAAAALSEEGHAGRVYEVTGPRSMTFAEAVGEVAAAAGRAVRYRQVSMDDFAAGLGAAGVPEDAVGLLRYLFTEVLDGRNEGVTDGVERALGRAPREFAAYARGAAAQGVWSAGLAVG